MLKIFFFFILIPIHGHSQWEEGTSLPGNGKWADSDRSNILELKDAELKERIERGKQYAVTYPVSETSILFPYELFLDVFDDRVQTPFKKFLYKLIRKGAGHKSTHEFFKDIGMASYPTNTLENYSDISKFPKEYYLGLPMGVQLQERFGIKGMTFGCAACHTSELFGRKILGMTNRFPEGSDLFARMAGPSRLTPANLVNLTLGLSHSEAIMVRELIQNLRWVRSKAPIHKSLDSSFSQVGMTLHYRVKDEYASKKKQFISQKHPLELSPADSKPLVWWNVKYKTRWLADGSVVSGNPIFTNYLWNEIGRGADLKQFDSWFKNNQELIKDMTATVFATKAPYYLDFFSVNELNLEKAKRGEQIYQNNCQKCHGVYIKNWSVENIRPWTTYELYQTNQVKYHRKTPVFNVGTSDKRLNAMATFSDDLNRLKISKQNGTFIKPQKGYVAPPLVGIWARWPYFHNNSIPSLCALLTPSDKRPVTFWTGQPVDPEEDFDRDCNGYPFGDKVPQKWKENQRQFFDTTKVGMSNQGHDKQILLNPDGSEKLSSSDKIDLIEFLKTL